MDKATEHEQQLPKVYQIIGRTPGSGRTLAGTLMAKAREGVADVLGASGGAAGGWTDLHQLFLASLNAISAVSTAQEIALALGIGEIVSITFPMITQKFVQHRMLQEITLETATLAIVYQHPI